MTRMLFKRCAASWGAVLIALAVAGCGGGSKRATSAPQTRASRVAAGAAHASLVTKLGSAHLVGGQTTIGADLSQAPDAQFDCTVFPLGNGGSQPAFGEDSTCTWTTATGGTNPTGGLLTPAGTGTITTVRVRVGQTTGPMQLVVLTLEFNPTDGSVRCCSAAYAGPAFTPTANAVTTIPANIPVHTDADGQESAPPLQVGDLLGLSVLKDGVPIPAIDETGSGLAQNQMPSDEVEFPAYQQGQTAPASGTVGFQLDMNADWVPNTATHRAAHK